MASVFKKAAAKVPFTRANKKAQVTTDLLKHGNEIFVLSALCKSISRAFTEDRVKKVESKKTGKTLTDKKLIEQYFYYAENQDYLNAAFITFVKNGIIPTMSEDDKGQAILVIKGKSTIDSFMSKIISAASTSLTPEEIRAHAKAVMKNKKVSIEHHMRNMEKGK